jgi:hypothetical protein
LHQIVFLTAALMCSSVAHSAFKGISANGLAWRMRPVYVFLLLAVGLFLLPVNLRILLPAALAQAYAPAMAFPAIHVETSQNGLLPEWLAGRLGWEQMAAAVHDVYSTLPPAEQRRRASWPVITARRAP